MDEVSGEEISIILFIGMSVMFLLATAIVFFVLLYKKRMAEQSLSHQKKLIQVAVDIQEEERKRFAADLHDEVGGGISTVLLSVSNIKSITDVGEYSSRIRKQLNSLLQSVREISYNITPDVLEAYGLQASLDDLCYQIQESGNIEVKLSWLGEYNRLVFSDELAIYRICKELISNTIKHAKASKIELSIESSDNGFKLHYQDNGKGFNQEVKSKGIGMKNMVNRAKIINAEFLIRGSIGNGVEATLTLNG